VQQYCADVHTWSDLERREIARGGEAIVSEVIYQGEPCVLRELMPGVHEEDPDAFEGCLRAMILAQGVPNTPRLIAYSFEDQTILMDLIVDDNVDNLWREGRLPEFADAEILGLLRTVEQLHCLGLRVDPKPRNFYYSKEDGFKVSDFELNGDWDSEAECTRYSSFTGISRGRDERSLLSAMLACNRMMNPGWHWWNEGPEDLPIDELADYDPDIADLDIETERRQLKYTVALLRVIRENYPHLFVRINPNQVLLSFRGHYLPPEHPYLSDPEIASYIQEASAMGIDLLPAIHNAWDW